MPKVFDVMAATGRYTDANGQEKTRWQKCGAVIQNANGNMSMILDCIPLGTPVNDNGHGIWFNLFEPQQPQQPQQQGGGFRQSQPQGYGGPAQGPQGPAPSPNTAPVGQGQVPPASDNNW